MRHERSRDAVGVVRPGPDRPDLRRGLRRRKLTGTRRRAGTHPCRSLVWPTKEVQRPRSACPPTLALTPPPSRLLEGGSLGCRPQRTASRFKFGRAQPPACRRRGRWWRRYADPPSEIRPAVGFIRRAPRCEGAGTSRVAHPRKAARCRPNVELLAHSDNRLRTRSHFQAAPTGPPAMRID